MGNISDKILKMKHTERKKRVKNNEDIEQLIRDEKYNIKQYLEEDIGWGGNRKYFFLKKLNIF